MVKVEIYQSRLWQALTDAHNRRKRAEAKLPHVAEVIIFPEGGPPYGMEFPTPAAFKSFLKVLLNQIEAVEQVVSVSNPGAVNDSKRPAKRNRAAKAGR